MRGLLLTLAALATAEAAHAAPVAVRTDELRLVMVAASAEATAYELKDTWPAACEALAAALRPGSGPWGLGAFPQHSCAFVELSILDKDDKDGAKRLAKESREWTLLVRVGKRETELELLWKGASEPLAAAGFKAEWPADMLADADFARILAARLLDRTPFLGRIEDAGSLKTTPVPAKPKAALPPPPNGLTIYTLAYDADKARWIPRAVGTAKLVRKDADRVEWQVAGGRKLAAPAQGSPLYVLSASGRGHLAKALEKRQKTVEAELGAAIAAKKNELSLANAGALLRRGVSSGYFGVRYGHSIFQGPVIQDMSFFGVLLELRGAPFDGLRFYYDMWPEVREAVVTGAESFSGARAVIGWSFGFDPGAVLTRIDAVPKLGLWSTRTRFLVETEDGTTQRVNFEVTRAIGLGIEIGAERDAGWVLARAWAARDFGFNPFQKGEGATSVANTRFGFDAFIDGPNFGLLGRASSLSFLLFGVYENVALQKDQGAQVEGVTIDKIEYDVGYVGGGLAISY